MKAVLISIQPKWCELIASGKKTIEVRKTKPKLETPFKCYIYCTSSNVHECLMQNESGVKFIRACNYKTAIPIGGQIANGKVIGEFVCDEIFPIRVFENGSIQDYVCHGMEGSCVPYDDISSYIGNGRTGYGWHISDLVIYDKPQKLKEFKKAGFLTEEDWLAALYPNTHCHYEAWAKKFEIKKPPQSWCYVEELEGVKII